MTGMRTISQGFFNKHNQINGEILMKQFCNKCQVTFTIRVRFISRLCHPGIMRFSFALVCVTDVPFNPFTWKKIQTCFCPNYQVTSKENLR